MRISPSKADKLLQRLSTQEELIGDEPWYCACSTYKIDHIANNCTLVRYDNPNEATKGHELHTATGIIDAEFPGIEAILAEFWANADE